MSIRLEPTAPSVAMSRVFVSAVLGAAGAPEEVVDDARLLVSDMATGLVTDGEEIMIVARFGDRSVTVSGNCPALVPEAGAALLGPLLVMGDGGWALTVNAP